jgi:hypothetical protein
MKGTSTIVSRYQTTTGEHTADCEDLGRAAVNCRECELAIALYLLIVTICKCSTNPITNPNPVYSHSHTWQYPTNLILHLIHPCFVCLILFGLVGPPKLSHPNSKFAENFSLPIGVLHVSVISFCLFKSHKQNHGTNTNYHSHYATFCVPLLWSLSRFWVRTSSPPPPAPWSVFTTLSTFL